MTAASITRRSLLTLGAAAVLAKPALVNAQSASALVRLRVASAPDEDILPCLYAQEAGIFRRYGLDLEVQRANSGAAVAAAIAGNAIDIGKASLTSVITAHVRGLPFTLVAPAGVFTSDAPVAGTIVGAGSPLRDARDLNGKLVGVASLKGLNQICTMSWVDQHGGDSRTLRFLELPGAAVAQALDERRIDAGTIANPELEEAIASKKARVLAFSAGAIAPRFLMAAYICTKEFAEQKRDVVERFARALREASIYANMHHAETAELLSRFTSIERKTILQMTRVTFGTSLDPREIQPLVDASVRYKVIASGFPAAEMIAPFMRTSA